MNLHLNPKDWGVFIVTKFNNYYRFLIQQFHVKIHCFANKITKNDFKVASKNIFYIFIKNKFK